MKTSLIWLLKGYKTFISPILPPACRYSPTCSEYAMGAIARFGARQGSYLALKRLCRCHPFHPGGYDPVPSAEELQQRGGRGIVNLSQWKGKGGRGDGELGNWEDGERGRRGDTETRGHGEEREQGRVGK